MMGHSRFEHTSHGIAAELLEYVPLADPMKISRLAMRNLSGRTRRLSVTAYVEWVLGASRGAAAPFVTTRIDPERGDACEQPVEPGLRRTRRLRGPRRAPDELDGRPT